MWRWVQSVRSAAQRKDVGARGERIAARYIRRQGVRILKRNLRLGHDEIDLLGTLRDGTLVIIEVKTRSTDRYPIESHVGGVKQHRMQRAAQRLLMNPAYADRAVRFDVVTVDLTERRPVVRHWEHAFEAR
ncbi:MAG: YraN family protein [Phycisphaerales bacterium]|nr:YraN family protein [Phycisphaerales bacterium]